MPGYLGALTVMVMIAMVIIRIRLLHKHGIEAMQFGKLDRSDFLIPPFALFYFYLVFAAAFNLPTVSRRILFNAIVLNWSGVGLCLLGLMLLGWSIRSFGRSFRVGIDTEQPGGLITTGAFAFSRNPIYLAFALILTGQFLIFPNWILLVYLVAAFWLFHRQVLREEDFLKVHYGAEYQAYCTRIRRYL